MRRYMSCVHGTIKHEDLRPQLQDTEQNADSADGAHTIFYSLPIRPVGCQEFSRPLHNLRPLSASKWKLSITIPKLLSLILGIHRRPVLACLAGFTGVWSPSPPPELISWRQHNLFCVSPP